MNKILRMTSLAATVAALAATATPSFAAPVGASTPGRAAARVYKPLTLTATRDLHFGTIVVSSVAAPAATRNFFMSISPLVQSQRLSDARPVIRGDAINLGRLRLCSRAWLKAG